MNRDKSEVGYREILFGMWVNCIYKYVYFNNKDNINGKYYIKT